jgi:cytochrome c-type biogenesis protein CcsB
MLGVLAACGFAPSVSWAQEQLPTAPPPFADQVNLATFGELAIHAEGRVKSLDSFTRAAMQNVSGSHAIKGRTPTFMYFDLMLRPAAYVDADVIHMKQKQMRVQVAQALREGLHADASQLPDEVRAELEKRSAEIEPRLDQFINTGLISAKMLMDPRVQDVLERLSTDLLRSAKFVEALGRAMSVMNPEALRANLKLVAPPGGNVNDPWLTMDELLSQTSADSSKLDPKIREQLSSAWMAFTTAWFNEDAAGVNDAAAQLVGLLPQVNPSVYPEQSRLHWESWYFRMYNLTWVWVLYALALIPLLLGIVFRWNAARWIGLGMFLIAFGMHTFAVMLRWYVAQRWPNSNMFEAVTTAAWFGGCLALVLEIVLRRSPMRNIFALGSATASMAALMAVFYLPLQLNPNISNMMPVLNDVWLYIHTNVIIFSYCLIFMASISAMLYLAYRALLAMRGAAGGASMQYARVGGAGSLIMTRPDGTSFLNESRSTFGQILDGTTMVMMEMSFIMLWTGLVMGAIWADHSWGRPWGWDPKEVFALNTFIIFLLLVHVRLKVKDKGLWTALLAVLGAAVMLFNWIIINFAISGLHSYA